MAGEVGQPAPDFTLYDHDRQQRALSEFKGKNVVLAFFPGAFTGVCTTEMCTLRDQASQFNSLNAQVLGISVDPPFSQKAWVDQNNLNFPILSDYNRQVVDQYDVALSEPGGNGRVCGREPGRVCGGQRRRGALQMGGPKPGQRA